MGATQSSLTAIKQNRQLQEFAGTNSINASDGPFWNELLSLPQTGLFSTTEESKQFEIHICSLLEQFSKNNLQTCNLAKLVKICVEKALLLKSLDPQDPNYKAILWQTYNATLIVRCCAKHLIQLFSEENVLKHFASSSTIDDGFKHLESLVSILIETVVDTDVNDETYALHVESINLLLVFFSIQMYSAKSGKNSVIFQIMLQQNCTIHSLKFMRRLLNNYIEQLPAPKTGGGSLIIGLASGFWNVLTLGYGREEDDGSDRLLAKVSLLLVLVMANHCCSDSNPYRAALFNCCDSQSNCASGDQLVSGFKIEYGRLFDVLCSLQNEDQSTLLLYFLLHKNDSFHNYVLSRTSDFQQLVIPILKILYTSSERNSHHIYMALIILLILSEDNLFNSGVHDIMLKNVTWYKDKLLNEISLGGLIVLILIRTIQFNMSRTIDKFLHTNLLATLANMSNHFKNLSTVVCEKIVVVFKKVTKRMNKILANLYQNNPASNDALNSSINSDAETDLVSNSGELIHDVSVYEQVLRIILEIINTALASQLTHNPNLVYTLLYNRAMFESYQAHPAFQDIVMNIETVLTYFENRVKSEDQTLTSDEVYSIIEHASLQWPADKLRKYGVLRFRYVEDDQPEEFFIPYIWTLVYRSSNLFFDSQNILLFNPHRNVI